MDKNKDDLDKISEPFSIQNKTKSLLFNPQFSDVSFLVEDELICAHKYPLILASPVFEKMFYGDLKMNTTKPIEITDITAIGFKNMLKYIYTAQIDLDFSNLFDTFLSADKYLVYDMIDSLSSYLKSKLDVSNCCLIYDQIMKIQNVSLLPLDDVKKMIEDNTQKAFESDYFTKIQPITLIDLLNLDQLNISELDLLKACKRYVNENVRALEHNSSQESKRKLFKQFKDFIRFGDLDPKDLAFPGIYDLLTNDEIAPLCLHLFNPEMRLNLEYSSKRRSSIIYSVSYRCSENQVSFSSIERINLKVNQNVLIKSIHTTVSSSHNSFDLLIFKDQNQDSKLEIEKFVLDEKWSFRFKHFEINPNTKYSLEFQNVPRNNRSNYNSYPYYNNYDNSNHFQTSSQLTSQFENYKKCFVFTLSTSNNYHFIEKINFSIP